ncbi:MAG: hypothetical protein ACKO5F_11920 [Synechococcus sp.]
MPEALPGGTDLLAYTAAVLLVFVSGGVIYLSAVEWRDRRRRYAHGRTAPSRKRSR